MARKSTRKTATATAKRAKGAIKKGAPKAGKKTAKKAAKSPAGSARVAAPHPAVGLHALTEEARQGVAAFATIAAAAAPPNLTPAEVERRHMIEVLRVKLRLLNEQARYLLTVRLRVTAPSERSRWIQTYGAVTLEQNLCGQRLEQLTAQSAFRNPGGPEEQSLLNAIRAVGQAAAQNAAFVTLVQRFLDVVSAYRADHT